jgi:hypothetical protein
MMSPDISPDIPLGYYQNEKRISMIFSFTIRSISIFGSHITSVVRPVGFFGPLKIGKGKTC